MYGLFGPWFLIKSTRNAYQACSQDFSSLDPRPFWPRARKGLGNNLARKCLERWNAAVGVDEGKDAFQPTSVRVLLMTGSEYTVQRRNFENWSST